MATATRISNAAAIAACNAIVDLLDAGSGAGYIEIRSGAPPTNLEDAATGTLISTHDLSDPAHGNASDANPGAIATANSIADAVAVATATAGWFRAYDSDDTPISQGTAGESDADMILDNADINTGQTVSITSWTVTVPELAS